MDQIWADLVGQGNVKVSTQVQKAAVVILWLAMPGNEVAFFLLAAAWVDPGRSALQSAEQRCKGRYGRIHQVGKMSF